MTRLRTNWQLPTGVTRGVWDYVQADHIAKEYDEYFSDHRLMELDLAIVRRFVGLKRRVADLGCGSGRALVPLVREGRLGLAIDLSESMLKIVAAKAKLEGLPIECLRGNLVDLRCLARDSVDDAICLFSTLGMIHGDENRRKAVGHMQRVIRPGGVLILHVHNLWHNLLDPRGPWWLVGNLIGSAASLRRGRGDRIFDYRGIRDFYVHAFTRAELRRLLTQAGFRIVEWNCVGSSPTGRLDRPWMLSAVRAQGWVVVCRV